MTSADLFPWDRGDNRPYFFQSHVQFRAVGEAEDQLQTSLKRVNSDKKNPKSNSLTIARHLPVEIRKLLVIREANLE